VTTRSHPPAFRTINEASDWVIDQFVGQLREARAEHNTAAAKMRAEFNSQVAEIRKEFDAVVAERIGANSISVKDLRTSGWRRTPTSTAIRS
jgi:hypothetical protein